MLSDEQISKFQILYKNRFKKEISKAEAIKKASKLVHLIELICKPIIIMRDKKHEK